MVLITTTKHSFLCLSFQITIHVIHFLSVCLVCCMQMNGQLSHTMMNDKSLLLCLMNESSSLNNALPQCNSMHRMDYLLHCPPCYMNNPTLMDEYELLNRQFSSSMISSLLSLDNYRRSSTTKLVMTPQMEQSVGAFNVHLLHNPATNKDTAFTVEDRKKYGLRGLLPPRVETITHQLVRALRQVRSFKNPLDKYIYLMTLQVRNQTLFFRLLIDNMVELLPIGMFCVENGVINC